MGERGRDRDGHRGRGGSDRDSGDKEKERSSNRDKKYDRYEEQHAKPSGPGPLASVPQNSGGVSNSKDVLALMDNTLWNRQMLSLIHILHPKRPYSHLYAVSCR